MSQSVAPLVDIQGLHRDFAGKTVLDNLNLVVPRGGVFGLIGGNGAGKTTLIKHLIGMLKAQSGTVRVFGLDPVAHPVEVLGRIGYLSEDRDLPNWMRVGELIAYTGAFYPTWDKEYAEELRTSFELDRQTQVKSLSRGQRARMGLLLALAHRPDLLILDEPSSGLDPVVRRDILGAIIRAIADEGRTVFFSSHLLDEVERVADRVAILHNHQIQLAATVDDLKERHRRITVRFARAPETPPSPVGLLAREGGGTDWTLILADSPKPARELAQEWGAALLEDTHLSLDEIFVSRLKR